MDYNENMKRVFGPVPSRRLGKSLGINNIPPKICTYSCIYCQLGRSLQMTIDRRTHYPPAELVQETRDKIQKARDSAEAIDYLTIVPDGEPTLDRNLGKLIEGLRSLGFPVAVITNSSLLHDPKVRTALHPADWVSLKVDSADEKTWRKIDRPHGRIDFGDLREGLTTFSREYRGQLVTETMLVRRVNTDPGGLERTAALISTLKPACAYLSVPTRPPAEPDAVTPSEAEINRAWQIFNGQKLKAEYLIGYEGNRFAFTGNIEEDLLSITAVHPMREDAVEEYLKKAGGDFSVVEQLVRKGKITVNEYNRHRFYLRRIGRPPTH